MEIIILPHEFSFLPVSPMSVAWQSQHVNFYNVHWRRSGRTGCQRLVVKKVPGILQFGICVLQ